MYRKSERGSRTVIDNAWKIILRYVAYVSPISMTANRGDFIGNHKCHGPTVSGVSLTTDAIKFPVTTAKINTRCHLPTLCKLKTRIKYSKARWNS